MAKSERIISSPVSMDGDAKYSPAAKTMSSRSRESQHARKAENIGRWTKEEHQRFLVGLNDYGRDWKKIAGMIETRTVVQVRTHAQKYFQKLQKQQDQSRASGDMEAASPPPPSRPKSSKKTAKRKKDDMDHLPADMLDSDPTISPGAKSSSPVPMVPSRSASNSPMSSSRGGSGTHLVPKGSPTSVFDVAVPDAVGMVPVVLRPQPAAAAAAAAAAASFAPHRAKTRPGQLLETADAGSPLLRPQPFNMQSGHLPAAVVPTDPPAALMLDSRMDSDWDAEDDSIAAAVGRAAVGVSAAGNGTAPWSDDAGDEAATLQGLHVLEEMATLSHSAPRPTAHALLMEEAAHAHKRRRVSLPDAPGAAPPVLQSPPSARGLAKPPPTSLSTLTAFTGAMSLTSMVDAGRESPLVLGPEDHVFAAAGGAPPVDGDADDVSALDGDDFVRGLIADTDQ